MNKIARKEEVQMQRDKEEEEEETGICVSSITLEPLVCNAQTRADLEANMYEHRKRVIFSQAMLKAMSMERTIMKLLINKPRNLTFVCKVR